MNEKNDHYDHSELDNLKHVVLRRSNLVNVLEEYKGDKEFLEAQKILDKIAEVRPELEKFVKEQIENGTLTIWPGHYEEYEGEKYDTTHGHLGFENDKYWGHYIFPTEDGVRVTVYEKKNIKGDPMDATGLRGEAFSVEIPLDEQHLEALDKLIGVDEEFTEEEWDKIGELIGPENNQRIISIITSMTDKDLEEFHILIDEGNDDKLITFLKNYSDSIGCAQAIESFFAREGNEKYRDGFCVLGVVEWVYNNYEVDIKGTQAFFNQFDPSRMSVEYHGTFVDFSEKWNKPDGVGLKECGEVDFLDPDFMKANPTLKISEVYPGLFDDDWVYFDQQTYEPRKLYLKGTPFNISEDITLGDLLDKIDSEGNQEVPFDSLDRTQKLFINKVVQKPEILEKYDSTTIDKFREVFQKYESTLERYETEKNADSDSVHGEYDKDYSDKLTECYKDIHDIALEQLAKERIIPEQDIEALMKMADMIFAENGMIIVNQGIEESGDYMSWTEITYTNMGVGVWKKSYHAMDTDNPGSDWNTEMPKDEILTEEEMAKDLRVLPGDAEVSVPLPGNKMKYEFGEHPDSKYIKEIKPPFRIRKK